MTAATRFDLIVFDWDGTLFDSTALIVRAIQQACQDAGVPVPSDERAAYVIGLGLHDALQHAVPGLDAKHYPRIAERYRHHYFQSQHELNFFPGTHEMLAALKTRGHRLAVATGKGRRGLDSALEAGSLRTLFDASRTADETVSKPHPRMLLELMQELNIAPGRTLMVGDTTHDLQLAANAGTASLAVSFGAHEAQAFDAHAPLAVLHSTAELHDWLVRYA
jgi:phosphoglycolate phosphatase